MESIICCRRAREKKNMIEPPRTTRSHPSTAIVAALPHEKRKRKKRALKHVDQAAPRSNLLTAPVVRAAQSTVLTGYGGNGKPKTYMHARLEKETSCASIFRCSPPLFSDRARSRIDNNGKGAKGINQPAKKKTYSVHLFTTTTASSTKPTITTTITTICPLSTPS